MVARWLAYQFGVLVEGMRDVGLFVRELNSQYDPLLLADLIIGGRAEPQTRIADWFGSDSASLEVGGESIDEVANFIAASILRSGDSLFDQLSLRAVFLDEPGALQHFSDSSRTTIVIPTTAAALRRVRAIPARGMRVVVPTSRAAGSRRRDSAVVRLGTVRREACRKALEAMKVPPMRADRIARESKGSLTALLWMLAQEPDAPLPWTVGAAAFELTPLVFAGQWAADGEADQTVISALFGRPYAEVEKTVAAWRQPGGPLIRRGAIWDWLAWDFAWASLAPSVTGDMMRRFGDAVRAVLATPDPKYSLPADDRWLSRVKGKVHPHSAQLRAGLVGSIVQFALNDAAVLSGSGQVFSDSLVRDLLRSNAVEGGISWMSLSPWLSDLAEASPGEFLASAESLIANPHNVAAIFEESSVLFGSHPHTGLLWAMERLAWRADLLPRVTMLLGKLAALDRGGKLSNRPSNTLRAIFLPWLPQTTADALARLSIIEQLYAQLPEVGWKLALALLPRPSDIGSFTARPQWRDWPVREARVTQGEYFEFAEPLARLMLNWAGREGKRWRSLIEAYDHLATAMPDIAQDVLATLGHVPADSLADADRNEIYESLLGLSQRHREFPDAEWSLKGPQLAAIDELCRAFHPRKLADRYRQLFDSWPWPLRGREVPFEERMRQVDEARRSAAAEIFGDGDLDAVFRFAEIVARPDAVGAALAELPVEDALRRRLVRSVLSVEPWVGDKLPPLFVFGLGYIARCTRREGDSWIDWAASLEGVAGNAVALANLAWGLPARAAIWDRLDKWGFEVAELYWRRAPMSGLDDPDADAERAVIRLLAARRPLRAVDIAALYVHGSKHPANTGAPWVISSLTLERALRSAGEEKSDEQLDGSALSNLAHAVGALLDVMEKQGANAALLARLEWLWMPAVANTQRGLKSLSTVLSESSETFVEILKLAFRAEGDSPRDLTEDERARATQAFRLLESWHAVPGQTVMSGGEPASGQSNVTFLTGTVDGEKLLNWVVEARKMAAECGRLDICDDRIGNMLAYAVIDPDGTWPCEAVREVLEKVQSEGVESGIATGIYNKRGVHFRGKGGDQERALAAKYEELRKRIQTKWPRTEAMLQSIVQSYLSDAQREDQEEEFEEFE